MFSGEATFHISGKVNKHNVRMWGSGNPHATVEHIRDSPEVNVWCGLWRDLLVGPVFFADATVPSSNYLDMLEKLQELQPAVFFQQDGATSHWSLTVRASLNQHFPNRWIGCAGTISWPTRSPDITPCDFFPMGIRKRLCVLNFCNQHQRFEGQNCSCYCKSWRWLAAAYIDGAWIPFGHCTCYKRSSCWMLVVLRTNFEFLSQMTLKQCVYVLS
jgi:hypothetical protein